MKRVIITDIKYRMTLSPIWELGHKGYDITAVSYGDVRASERLGFFSKHVSSKEVITDETFCERIEEICKTDRPVLLPGNRRSLTHVIRNRERLSACCDFLVPDESVLMTADDKSAMYRIAEKVGVPTPFTTTLADHDSIEAMADCIRFPCIIKYRNGEVLGMKPAERYTVVSDRKSFIDAYSKMHAIDANPIASDYISGRDIGVAVVMNQEHEPIQFLCYESLREYPIQGGPTCFLRTIHSTKLVEYSVRLLREIHFTGIAMLDFKGTPEDPYFLEINPRLWGSAAITYLSKCDFFESYVRGATEHTDGLDAETAEPSYRLNTKMRFTPQSLVCFAAHMAHSSGKGRILLQYAKSLLDPFVHDGLFTLNDPIPYVKYIQNLIRRS